MVTISKYSKEDLLQYVNALAQKVYLFFYDLDFENFDDAIHRLSDYLDIIETKIIKVRNERYLAIFGYLKSQKLQSLVTELDMMDVGEIDMSEYQDNREVIDSVSPHIDTVKNFCKKIYINKDEKIIQLYNFY